MDVLNEPLTEAQLRLYAAATEARVRHLEDALAVHQDAWGEVIGNDTSNRPGGCPGGEQLRVAVAFAYRLRNYPPDDPPAAGDAP